MPVLMKSFGRGGDYCLNSSDIFRGNFILLLVFSHLNCFCVIIHTLHWQTGDLLWMVQLARSLNNFCEHLRVHFSFSLTVLLLHSGNQLSSYHDSHISAILSQSWSDIYLGYCYDSAALTTCMHSDSYNKLYDNVARVLVMYHPQNCHHRTDKGQEGKYYHVLAM